MKPNLTLAISGASGAICGIRLLEALREMQGIATHLIISKTAQLTIAQETYYNLKQAQALADVVHNVGDLAAPISSGLFQSLGMVIAPCSMRS